MRIMCSNGLTTDCLDASHPIIQKLVKLGIIINEYLYIYSGVKKIDKACNTVHHKSMEWPIIAK